MLAAAPCRVWWITMCVCNNHLCRYIHTHICHTCRYDDRVYVHMFFIPSKFRVFWRCESIFFFNTLWHTYVLLSHTHISTQSNAYDSMNESFDKSRTNKKIIVQSQDYYDVFQQNTTACFHRCRHNNAISAFFHKAKRKIGRKTRFIVHIKGMTHACVRFHLILELDK